LIDAALELGSTRPLRTVCKALGTSRSTLLRRRCRSVTSSLPRKVRLMRNQLAESERSAILQTLNSDRFADLAPAQIHAQLIDEGTYLCSVSTMYRLLRASGEICERRRLARHPVYHKPELLATQPRELLSWDVTKVRGPHKGVWFSLLVMIDVFSRYVVGWMLVGSSNASIAEHFIAEVMKRENILPGQAALHADRGPEMTAQPVCALLDKLGVTRSHSRPHVSDDNPYSESQFKTLKYHHSFPERFGSLEDGRAFFGGFFTWYNTVHRHSGITMLAPAMVHNGRANDVLDARHAVMQAAFTAHPDRFIAGSPKRLELPSQVWINPPTYEDTAT
jgi:putative transposase